MLFRDENFFIYDSETGLAADNLTNQGLMELDKHLGGCTVSVDCYPGSKMLIPVSEYYPSLDVINIKSFYKKLEMLSKNPAILATLSPNITLEMANNVIAIALNIQKRTSLGALEEDITDWLVKEHDVISVYKVHYSPNKVIYKCQNVDVVQKKPTDRLFYKLPEDSLITSSFDYNIVPLPQINQLCKAYPSPLYQTFYIKKIMDAPQNARLTQIQYAVNNLRYMDYEVSDATVLMQEFKLIPKEYVFGNPENNSLPLQENEYEYYDALIIFIKHHIHLFNKDVMVDASKEEIEAKDEKDFNTGNLPKRLELYLGAMLCVLTRYHYGHTGRFVLTKGLFMDDETAVESNNDNFEISYATESRGSDADLCVKEYIQLSAQTFGASMWAEGLVKMARWGERKPTVLEIGENNPNVIELTMFNVQTATLNFANLEKITENDRSLYVSGYILYEFLVDGISSEIPAILIICEKYKNPADKSKVEQVFSLIAVQDFIRLFRHGVKNNFVGVEYIDGEFQVEDDYEIPLCADSTSALEAKTITTEYFVKLCMKHDITNAKPLASALINHTAVRNFIPQGDDYLMYLSNHTGVLKANAFLGIMLDAFEKSVVELDFNYLSNYLNQYQNIVYPKYEELMTCFEPQAILAHSSDTYNLFNGIDQVDTGDIEDVLDFDFGNEEEEQYMTNLYKGDLSHLEFMKLINKKSKEGAPKPKFIGGVAIDNSIEPAVMVFASVDDDVKYNPLAPPVIYANVSSRLLGAAIARDTKSSVKTTHQFVSESTLETIYQSII